MKLPKRLGRYDTVKLLGCGAEGAVLLAKDRELGRPVALKLLRPDAVQDGHKLVREARIVSQLQHANIVTLYDVGQFGPCPYLIFEYIDGESLKQRIERAGKLGFRDSVILMSQVLAGVAYMHENGVVHRDLKPANILISRQGLPKVADFGVSAAHAADTSHGEGGEVWGTLRYASPEAIQGIAPHPGSDVFALCGVFFEMLTGSPLLAGETAQAIAYEVVHGAAVDCAERGLELAPALAEVLRVASQRDPALRYPHARAMKDALDAYRLPRDDDTAPRGEPVSGSVDYLLRRISRRKGFSSLSAHIGKVLELTSEHSVTPAKRLVNVLAKDITLTQRVISQANAAATACRGVNDLPGAVRMLGLERVRVCVTRTLLEQQFELGSEQLRETMLLSFHAALLAKAVARECGVCNGTDAYTGAMFHDLGRMLTIHYLADDYEEIVQRARDRGSDEITESRLVLGIAFHELGMVVGGEWRLSGSVLDCMRPLPRGVLAAPVPREERLRLCTAAASAASRLLAESPTDAERKSRIADLLGRVGSAVGLDEALMDAALAEAADLVPKYARLIRLDPDRNAVARSLCRTLEPAA